MAQGSLY